MLDDIVIDTNVMLHADDSRQGLLQVCSRDFLIRLRDCDARLCVDEGFHVDEAKNRSHIAHEYKKHLRFGMLGNAVIAHLASRKRIKMVPRKVPARVSKAIIRGVRSAEDRIFVRVAFNSQSKTLASHDFQDIPALARIEIGNSIAVRICTAEDARQFL